MPEKSCFQGTWCEANSAPWKSRLVSPQKHPSVKKELGQQFIDWLVSPDGQKAIADYKIDGQQLFYPNANDPNA